MSYELVTEAQAWAVQQMANCQGVGLKNFQDALDDGRFGRFLDSLKEDSVQIVPPPGARIKVVQIRYKQDQPWPEAVRDAGPDTPSNYDVWKMEVGDLYQPTGTKNVEETLILLNLPNDDGGWDKANEWALTNNLKRTVPRQVFAVGKNHPDLYRRLGINPMYVVATTERAFKGRRFTCYVWWLGSKRGARLYWVECFDDSSTWFAFCE